MTGPSETPVGGASSARPRSPGPAPAGSASSARPPRPVALPFTGLPPLPVFDELLASVSWVAWEHRFIEHRKAWVKMPINPRTGENASASDPATWGPYGSALAHKTRRDLDGVGFALEGKDDVVGIDLDGVVDPETGAREPWVEEVLRYAESYAELSPSGTGIHLLVRGEIEKSVVFTPASVEIYQTGRYFTITGRHIEGTPTEIRPAPRTLAFLLARVETFRAAAEAAKQAEAEAAQKATRPNGPASEEGHAGGGSAPGGDFFQSVNSLALERLSSWVLVLFPSARPQPGTRGFRVSSQALGRKLQEDLSITPQGIKDWGVHDMGDPRDGRRTAIDLVLEHGPSLADAVAAALWLCDQLRIDPASLGWRGNGGFGGFGGKERTAPGGPQGEAFGTNGTFGTASGHTDGGAWDTPDLSLLGTGRRPAPDFPLALLGPFWSSWTSRRAAAASSPVDYVATALLACAGGALANVRRPLAGVDWQEPSLLWIAAIGDPTFSKSPGQEQSLALLTSLEDRLGSGHDEERRAYETKKQIAEIAREGWKGRVKEALKNGDRPPVLPADAEAPNPPERPCVRVTDYSTERLAELAAALPRGLLMMRDELSGWLGTFDRYSGKGSDRAFAVEMYGGRPHTVERVKNPLGIKIRHLSVGVLGSIQPDKLAPLLAGPNDGLMARFLWCWPETSTTFELARGRSDESEAQAAFARLADLHMDTDPFGRPEPIRVRLSPAAENELEGFAREMQRRGRDVFGPMAEAIGKARGHALRLSAVLTFLRWCGERDALEPTTITADAVTRAAALVESYFLPMAERVFGDAAIPPAERAAMALARHLRRLGLHTFNARTLGKSLGGPFREAEAMKRACADLAEAGLVRATSAGAKPQGGRPSTDWEVNPALHGREP